MQNNIETIETLLNNESFLSWATGKKKGEDEQWRIWLQSDESNKQLAEEALAVYNRLRIPEVTVDSSLKRSELSRLMKVINKTGAPASRLISLTGRKLIAIAAGFAIILGSYAIWKIFYKQEYIQTAYGEMKELKLADGTVIILNSNSSLNYPNSKTSKNNREVWIKGEAFFKVAKASDHSKFIVHTGEFDVVVTGTEFNVVNRDNSSSVLLVEGKITLVRGKETIAVKPGELVEVNPMNNKPEVTKKHIPVPDRELAWLDKRMVLSNTTLKEVAIKISELYGVQVLFPDPAVQNKTISGILPNDNLNILLEALKATADFDVEKNGDSIIIKPGKTNN